MDAEIFLVLLGLGLVAVLAVAVRLGPDLRGRDQLGQHPGERVDLVTAQLRARGELRRALAEHALEAEHQGIADLPFVRGLPLACLDLGERIVEGAPPGRLGRKRHCRIFIRVEEGLSGPCFGPEGGSG